MFKVIKILFCFFYQESSTNHPLPFQNSSTNHPRPTGAFSFNDRVTLGDRLTSNVLRCDNVNCREINKPLKKCSTCKSVSYCSKNCQKVNWPNHRINCKRSEENTSGPGMTSSHSGEMHNLVNVTLEDISHHVTHLYFTQF